MKKLVHTSNMRFKEYKLVHTHEIEGI